MSEWKSTIHVVQDDTQILHSAYLVCSQDVSEDSENNYTIELMIGRKSGGLDLIGVFNGSKNSMLANEPMIFGGKTTSRKMIKGETVVVRLNRYGSPDPYASAFTVNLRVGRDVGNSNSSRKISADVGYMQDQRVMQAMDSMNNAIGVNDISEWTVSAQLKDSDDDSVWVDPSTGVADLSQLGTGTPNSTKYLRGDGKWVNVYPWNVVKLSSEFATTSTTAQTVTGLSFTPSVSKDYVFKYMLILRSATTGAAARLGLTWPSSITDGAVQFLSSVSSNTTATTNLSHLSQTAGTSLNSAETTWGTGGVTYMTTGSGILVTGASTSGNLDLTIRSETGASVAVRKGSIFMWAEV